MASHPYTLPVGTDPRDGASHQARAAKGAVRKRVARRQRGARRSEQGGALLAYVRGVARGQEAFVTYELLAARCLARS